VDPSWAALPGHHQQPVQEVSGCRRRSLPRQQLLGGLCVCAGSSACNCFQLMALVQRCEEHAREKGGPCGMQFCGVGGF